MPKSLVLVVFCARRAQALHRTCAALQAMRGAVAKAQEIAANTENSYVLQQFENPANAAIHRQTTGPEIWRDTAGQVGLSLFGPALPSADGAQYGRLLQIHLHTCCPCRSCYAVKSWQLQHHPRGS